MLPTTRRTGAKTLALAFLLVVALATLAIGTAQATTFIVNSTKDPGDGTCDATEWTLREAIDAANHARRILKKLGVRSRTQIPSTAGASSLGLSPASGGGP